MTYKFKTMKKFLLTTMTVVFSLAIFAQTETDTETKSGGFKKENLFTGGNLNISFFSGGTVLGATPQLGYAVTNWLDAGISAGYTYIAQRDAYDIKYRQSIIAPGAFVRVFPLDFLFVTAQYEHNFLRQKIINPNGGGISTNKYDVNSLLAGLGYTSGRQGNNSPYYYFSVSFDILNQPNSPYNDFRGSIFPVVNAGFNIPLFQGGGRRGR